MRWVRRILVGLLVVILVAAATGLVLVRRPFPQTSGEAAVAGLEYPVEVIRDIDGIPHIYAETSRDLYFAQGYVHAQDRFWQMDFWRHIGSGRLAEMFGESQVDSDVFLRSLGWERTARQELERLDPQLAEVLHAYADGVNAYISGRSPSQLGLEYTLLGLLNPDYEIAPWTPVHTLTWGKAMAWDLDGNFRAEIDRAILSATLPPERVEQLYPGYPDHHPPIVPSDRSAVEARQRSAVPVEAVPVLALAGERAEAVWQLTGGGFEGIGSNNWAVGGEHTRSRMPILADDTHLGIQMPSIWYQVGLHCTGPECVPDAIGFGFPGVPGVVVGHNETIAWGVTNQGPDVQDLFVERVHPQDPDSYLVGEQWVEMEVREEIIEIAGAEDLTVEMRSTRHGPLISETFLADGELDGSAADPRQPYVVSLSWTALQPSSIFQAILGINRATSYEEFRRAASLWDIAGQNLVYADVQGNIAYQSTGRIPIRSSGDGRWPAPGWVSDHDWVGFVPFEEMPRLLNPPRGYVATANQAVTRPGLGPFENPEPALGYRAARIEQLIQVSSTHSVETMQQLQIDGHDGSAAFLVASLLAVDSDRDDVAEVQELLGHWSEEGLQADSASAGAAAYLATWRHLLRLTFHDEMPEGRRPEGGSRWFEVVRNLLETPDDPWWDDVGSEAREDRDTILEQAMTDAHDELSALLGGGPESWSWGRLHRARFENQTLGQSGIGPIEWLFNRAAPPRVSGSESLVNATGWDPEVGYEVDWLPSFRMVIDLGDFSASTFIVTTGPSGHAFHRHYASMIADWADGVQRPMRWARHDVEEAGSSRLVLLPGG